MSHSVPPHDPIPNLLPEEDTASRSARVLTRTYYGLRRPDSPRLVPRRRTEPPVPPAAMLPKVKVPPAEVSLDRFPITTAWLSGARVEMFAQALALGYQWKIGVSRDASGPRLVWRKPGVSQEDQVTVWLVAPGGPRP